ncbi:MAG: carboxypeptidase-like regulatory domain-containing protein [Planctomycetota bacterium]|jgi:hypothetical protein
MDPRRLRILALLALCLVVLLALVVYGDVVFGDGIPDPEGSPATVARGSGSPGGRNKPGAPDEDSVAATGRVVLPTEAEVEQEFQRALAGFRGRALFRSGGPAAGKDVVLYRFDSAVFRNADPFAAKVVEPMVPTHETQTGADGRFEVTGVWPVAVYIVDIDSTGGHRTWQVIEQTPGPGEIVDLGDILLEDLGVIRGRVVDPDGESVNGALVYAANLPPATFEFVPLQRFDPEGTILILETMPPLVVQIPSWVLEWLERLPFLRGTRTGEDGSFRVIGVQPGHNTVLVNQRGLLPVAKRAVRVQPGKEKDVGRIRLREGEIVRGKVIDTAGKPVVGAQVLAGNTIPFVEIEMATPLGVTDKNGMFEGGGFARGKIVVAVRRDAGKPWTMHGPKAVDEDLLVQLPTLHTLILRLQSRAGHKIDAPRLKMLASSTGTDGLDLGTMGFVPWLDIDSRTTRLDDNRYRIERLEPGDYAVAVTAEGHGTASLTINIPLQAEELVLLPPRGSFEVIVQNTEQRPIGHAAVYYQVKTEDDPDAESIPVHAGRTDRGGRLLVPTATAGMIDVSVTHPAYGTVHARFHLPRQQPVHLTMQSPGSLKGRLTEAGAVPTPGKWTLVVMPVTPEDAGTRPLEAVPRFAVAGVEGGFGMRGLQPGRYTVIAIESLKAISKPGGMLQLASPFMLTLDRPEQTVVITAGRESFVALDAVRQGDRDAKLGRVTGMVMVNGQPGSGMTIACFDGRRPHQVKVDAAGRFVLGDVPVGKRTVLLLDNRGRGGFAWFADRDAAVLWSKDVEVEVGHDAEVDISVETGSATGTVLTSGGVPAAHVRVTATSSSSKEDDKAQGYVSRKTDSHGRYVLDPMPAGKYDIRVDAPRFGVGRLRGVEVASGTTTRVPRLELEGIFRVSGRMDLSLLAGKGIEWVDVELKTETGRTKRKENGEVDLRTGRFRVDGLTPGTYIVRFDMAPETIGGMELVCDQKIVVADRDIPDVVIEPAWRKVKKPPKKDKR